MDIKTREIIAEAFRAGQMSMVSVYNTLLENKVEIKHIDLKEIEDGTNSDGQEYVNHMFPKVEKKPRAKKK
jgi:hypothetical protein